MQTLGEGKGELTQVLTASPAHCPRPLLPTSRDPEKAPAARLLPHLPGSERNHHGLALGTSRA